MVFGLLKSFLRKRKKLREAEKAATALLLGILETEAATSEMQAEARASNEPFVLLTPMVPISGQIRSGWFGGAPHLPDHVPWPEIEGQPSRFVCQIDLSALPSALWSGLGPRQGWLAVFVHPDKMAPKVLYVDGVLKKREGPAQADACWYWPQSYDKPLQSHSPEWPIMVTSHVGALPAPYGWRKGRAPGFPDPRDVEFPDLADTAFHPFNETTLLALIGGLSEYLESQVRRIDVFLTKNKLRDNDRLELDRLKREADRSLEQFSQIKDKLLPFTERFDGAPVGSLVSQIASIPTYELRYARDDEDGYAVLSYSRLKLCDKPTDVVGWYGRYQNALYHHSRYAHIRGSSSVPRELLKRMEGIWQFEAWYERGAMGHAPLGHLYTPHGPSTENAVLLELPTSDLVNWIWGDVYSIVLFINRDALARGDFDRVTAEITN